MNDCSAVRVFVVYSPSSFCLNSTSSTSQKGTRKMAQFLIGAFLADYAMAVLRLATYSMNYSTCWASASSALVGTSLAALRSTGAVPSTVSCTW